MNKPAFSSYVIGNRVVVIGLFSITGFVTYRYFSQDEHGESISWLVPAIAVLASRTSLRARRRIVQFTAWKGDWEQMSGASDERRETRRKRQRVTRPIKLLLGSVLAVALWSWLSIHSRESVTDAYGFLGLVAVLLSGWIAIVASAAGVRLARRIPGFARTAQARRGRSHIVAVCLPVPRASSSLRQIEAALPDYAQALLARDRRAVSGNAPTDSVQRN
jgi:hypothetical protein